MNIDKDLQSIQEVRNLVAQAKAAQKQFAGYTQEQVDRVVAAVAKDCAREAQSLARMACQETGFGNAEDKTLKNILGSELTYNYIRDMKTVGVLHEDKTAGIIEIASPMGVIAGIIPSTNPTSTTMYKALIALKGGNAIVFSPHPGAKKCILATYEIIVQALKRAGAPDGLVGCITDPTLDASRTLMQHRDVAMILATGGEGMVRAAYSSGNPALGVGPGNGPAFIERSADIKMAVKRIFDSKTFDNGTICASEQSIVTERCIAEQVKRELTAQGGYFLSPAESKQVGALLMRENGTMNPRIVGKTALAIAEMAGIQVPSSVRVLISEEVEVSRANPYSREKLCPVLGFYVEENWEQACERCIAILENEGLGHTMTIHSNDNDVVMQFALKKPVYRLLVNTPGALGGVGVTTNLAPALTLGCGTVGKSATSDNVTPMHLINIRRVAYGSRELEEVKRASGHHGVVSEDTTHVPKSAQVTSASAEGWSPEQIEAITRAVLERLRTQS